MSRTRVKDPSDRLANAWLPSLALPCGSPAQGSLVPTPLPPPLPFLALSHGAQGLQPGSTVTSTDQTGPREQREDPDVGDPEANARSSITGGGAGPAKRTLFRRSRQTRLRMTLRLTQARREGRGIAWCCLPRRTSWPPIPEEISLKDSMSVGAPQRHRSKHTGAPRRVCRLGSRPPQESKSHNE